MMDIERISAKTLAGIKRGCPALGSSRALAYDPIVRALCWAVPRDSGSFGVFTDCIGVAVRNLFAAMHDDGFHEWASAAGL